MVVFLLCLIVAILLFGSSKVLGAFGKILGFIVFVIGLGFLSSITGFDAKDIFGIFLLLILAICAYLAIFHPEQWKEMEKQRKLEEARKREGKS
jgi:uncharacterized membrane protein required for colicin V production